MWFGKRYMLLRLSVFRIKCFLLLIMMCRDRHGGYLGILGIYVLYEFGVGRSIHLSQHCHHFLHYLGV